MDSSTDAPSHLSDSEFWRMCHDLPAIRSAKKSDTSTNQLDDIVSILDESTESDEGIDPKHSDESDEAAQSSSDDSLHNLYAKKNQANDLFIESHANRVNTQRIYDTIELIDDNLVQNGNGDGSVGRDSDAKYNSLTSNESSNGNASTTTTTTSASNADDLLIKIAKNVKRLKENVTEIETTPIKSHFNGDLIDFNDENDHKTHGCYGKF